MADPLFRNAHAVIMHLAALGSFNIHNVGRRMKTAARPPIVLVHGLLRLRPREGWSAHAFVSYFPASRTSLRQGATQLGAQPELHPWCGSSCSRAATLRARPPNDRVHIIAHSMGGLDSRYMISRLGMENHVLSLTTIGTPHRGTAFADWGQRRLKRTVEPFLNFCGIPTDDFVDPTTASCARFNEFDPDALGVRYYWWQERVRVKWCRTGGSGRPT